MRKIWGTISCTMLFGALGMVGRLEAGNMSYGACAAALAALLAAFAFAAYKAGAFVRCDHE